MELNESEIEKIRYTINARFNEARNQFFQRKSITEVEVMMELNKLSAMINTLLGGETKN